MECFGKCAFVAVGLVASIFYAYYAVTAIGTDGKTAVTVLSERKPGATNKHHWAWWVHQTWINLCGSLLGWFAGYCFLFHRDKIQALSAADGLLLLVAVVGVFGFLPWRLYNTGIR